MIEKRGLGEEGELTDNEITAVLRKEFKKRQEAAELYTKGGRPELASKEKEEMKIITNYLPEPLSDEQLMTIIQETLKEEFDHSFSNIIKKVIMKTQGRADGKKTAELIKKHLGQSQDHYFGVLN